MKKEPSILVVCQYYFPEPFRITDICEELARRGHEVMVLTGEPNYPEGERYEGYRHGQRQDEIRNGVRIHRCYTVPRKTGSGMRILNYYSYAASSRAYIRSGKCLTEQGEPYDIVFCNQLSPIMMANAAILYKQKYGVPLLLYCLDLWPESLIAGGVSRDSLIYTHYMRVSSKIYGSCDKIIVTSRMFGDYLQDKLGINKKNIGYLPQYAEDIFVQQGHQISNAKKRTTTSVAYKSNIDSRSEEDIDLGEVDERKSEDWIDLMFAGNIGAIQSVDTIIKAADILKEERVRFHIVGSGTDLERLKKVTVENGLLNVIFYGRRGVEEMPNRYSMADAMLVTLKRDPTISLTLPGKVQTYMAFGKPIIGAIDGEAARVIEESGCGYCGPAEDADSLANNIRKLRVADNKNELSERAKKYYDSHFSKENCMAELERVMDNLIENK